MSESSLHALRDRIETLASETGSYYLVCARCGDRPVPAATLRFESRAVARVAADVTARYRSRLREYDPALPRYEIIVCETGPETGSRPFDAGLATHSEA